MSDINGVPGAGPAASTSPWSCSQWNICGLISRARCLSGVLNFFSFHAVRVAQCLELALTSKDYSVQWRRKIRVTFRIGGIWGVVAAQFFISSYEK